MEKSKGNQKISIEEGFKNNFDYEIRREAVELKLEEKESVRNNLEAIFKDNSSPKAIFGYDIYGYGAYRNVEQMLIPDILKNIYDCTVERMIKVDKIDWNYKDNFIDNGDGGFQILATPLDAIVFGLNFSAYLRLYSTYRFMSKQRNLVGDINIRYAITYDEMYCYNGNHYGSAIINNARIMSKDKLNRCLVDQNSNDWFQKKIGDIESLKFIERKDSYFFEKNKNRIVNCNTLKIGDVMSKNTKLNIYNLHVQSEIEMKNKYRLTATLGNLNTSGLIE